MSSFRAKRFILFCFYVNHCVFLTQRNIFCASRYVAHGLVLVSGPGVWDHCARGQRVAADLNQNVQKFEDRNVFTGPHDDPGALKAVNSEKSETFDSPSSSVVAATSVDDGPVPALLLACTTTPYWVNFFRLSRTRLSALSPVVSTLITLNW